MNRGFGISKEGGYVAMLSDTRTCPQCQATVPADATECPECGHRLDSPLSMQTEPADTAPPAESPAFTPPEPAAASTPAPDMSLSQEPAVASGPSLDTSSTPLDISPASAVESTPPPATAPSPATAPPPPSYTPSAPTAPPSYTAPVAAAGDKNKIVAAILALLFGGLGIHGFYLGNTTMGITLLAATIISFVLMFVIIGVFLLPIIGVICLVQAILYLVASDQYFYQKYVVEKRWF